MKETLLDVKGMTCSSCVRHIHQALDDLDGVKRVDVDLREGRVLVEHEATVDPATLCSAVEDAGYEASTS